MGEKTLDSFHPGGKPSRKEEIAMVSAGARGRVRGSGPGRHLPAGGPRALSRRRTWRFTKRFYALVGVMLVVILFSALWATLGSRKPGDSGSHESPSNLTTAEMASLKVNELGAIMIVRYGRIGEEGKESRSPENLRRDLQLLYQQGYRCIPLSDLLSGDIKTGPGFTPLVITFWGADPGQVRFLEDGSAELDPRCALGVLEDFGREHPDFGMTATFFLGKQLFGQESHQKEKLAMLKKKGYGLGVTVEPEAARLKDSQDALTAVAAVISAIRRHLPEFSPECALFPQEWREIGDDMGMEIPVEGGIVRLRAVLYDNGKPVASPYDSSFDPARLEAIRVVDPSMDSGGLYHWLRYFSENPERRFVSDGSPSTVTVPRHMVFRTDRERMGGRRLRNY